MKAVFVDRDGVLNVIRPQRVKSWDEFEFLPGVYESLATLARNGLPVVVFTNQAIVNRGVITAETLDDIHGRMVDAIERHGGRVCKVVYCPHRPEENCDCRKPKPGLLLQAAQELGLDLEQCYVIGDNIGDIIAGQSVGCRSILVLTGHGHNHVFSREARRQGGYHIVRDLKAAVRNVLAQEGLARPRYSDTLINLFFNLLQRTPIYYKL